ncbi:MAG: hypothetical protein ACFFDC_17150 [Promethearchaeota archaeon]
MKEKIDLLDIISLKEHYRNLVRDLKVNSSASDDLHEILRNVFTSNEIRIFLIGDIQHKRILIQVEMIPTAHITLEKFNSGLEKQPEIKSDILEHQIFLLEYLKILNEKGFTLNLVGEECIWYATNVLETEPTDELCELLNPLLKWAVDKWEDKI